MILPIEISATYTFPNFSYTFPISAANNSSCIELMINQHNCNNYTMILLNVHVAIAKQLKQFSS